jgi:hypothetical protein
LTVSEPFCETFVFLLSKQGQVDHPTLSDPLLFSFLPESGNLRLSVDRVEGGAPLQTTLADGKIQSFQTFMTGEAFALFSQHSVLRLTLVNSEAATITGLAVAHLSSDGD